MLSTLPSYPIDRRPQCLLLGNGINRSFDDPSWRKIVEDELKASGSQWTWNDISDMPATMQIVVATGDHVDERMEKLANDMIAIHMTQERKGFLQRFFDLPVSDIMTANYSFELEMADGMPESKSTYSHRLRTTREQTSREKAFRVGNYYQTSTRHRIWHIHGDIAKPSTMLMGHYYYAKQLRVIQDCAAGTVKRAKTAQRTGVDFTPENWVDLFLTGDVYILGFGLYLCESDVWYLLCCKKRNFPQTRTIFYDLQNEDLPKSYMLGAYGVSIVTGKDLAVSDYSDFYRAAMADIRQRVASRQES